MIDIIQAQHLGGTRLHLAFADGTEGDIDLAGELGKAPFLDVRGEQLPGVTVEAGSLAFPGSDTLVAPEWYYARAHRLRPPTTVEEVEANELAVSLRRVRELSGLTQVEVARTAHISQPEVARIEQEGDKRISTVTRYLAALGWELELVAKRGDVRVRLRGV